MLFVPLPLFATLALAFFLLRMITASDMRIRSNQIFALLVALYTLQSLLMTLRWGYQLQGFGIWIALLAPVLPVCAYLAYLSLMGPLTRRQLWPLAIIGLNWAVLIVAPELADAIILVTYFSFGVAILTKTRTGADGLALVRIDQSAGAARAMGLTGIALIASAFVDLFVIVDFARTGGRHVGLTVSLVQSGFLLLIGVSALMGHSGTTSEDGAQVAGPALAPTEQDAAIIARLTSLFETQGLHKDTELNLRRLSRRLGLPDRHVSQAINRTQGVSVSQFVNGFRVREACTMLEQTDQTILQVSLAAGFMTKSNFNREFSRVTGVTPSQWRRVQRPVGTSPHVQAGAAK